MTHSSRYNLIGTRFALPLERAGGHFIDSTFFLWTDLPANILESRSRLAQIQSSAFRIPAISFLSGQAFELVECGCLLLFHRRLSAAPFERSTRVCFDLNSSSH